MRFRKILGMFFLVQLCSPLHSLDLSINGRSYAVLSPEMLFSQAGTVNQNGDLPAVPLHALYPYMENVEYLEVEAGLNRVFWDASRIGENGWDDAVLVYREGDWELRVGRDVFSSPDRISVRGTLLDTGTLRIWYTPESIAGKDRLSAALAFRGVSTEWREVQQIIHLIADPPGGLKPHLVLSDDITVLRMGNLVDESGPYSLMSSQWYTLTSPDGGSGVQALYPYAVNAYHPESALLSLLAENPGLFEETTAAGFRTLLVRALQTALDERDSGRLLITGRPLTALRENRALSALLLPGETPIKSADDFQPVSPPQESINLIRRYFAALPSGLNPSDRIVAEMVLRDALRFEDLSMPANARVLPVNSRVPLFYDAYERIGRLALSGEITVNQAAELIVQSIGM